MSRYDNAVPIDHLYVHVPFCAARCDYCAFYSEAGSAEKMVAYIDALLMELETATATLSKRGYNLEPTTIFFGGGTPSLLPVSLMGRIFSGLHRHVPLQGLVEWTMECNPSTVTTEKARLFREFGVNRISMGVQVLEDELLDLIGRVHSVDAAIKSYHKMRDAGFDNINLDLMFGLPGQTLQHWRNTLAQAIALAPEHISTYCLILEEDTKFWRLFEQGFIKPDEELELAMYETAIEMLTAAGYRQYEVSNFAKSGRECQHNIACWEGKDYLGLGPSACSTVRDRRWQNLPDLDRYIAFGKASLPSNRDSTLQQKLGPPVAYEEVLTPELRATERAAFGMRMTAGVPADWVRGRWDKQIARLLSAELVQWCGERLAPTHRGILFADEIAAEFM
jgi:oxygen-independent coproporphyrinogen-3 oxidase